MANIESVKLPDGSEYNIADAVSGYSKKVVSATNNHIAALDATGDLKDSGISIADVNGKQDKTLATPLSIGGVTRTEVESSLGALNTVKQNEALTSPITIGGEQKTTVESAVSALNTVKQDKNLSEAITIEGTSRSTVETALAGLNTYANHENGALSAITNVYSAKNLLPNKGYTQVVNGATFTWNKDKSITINGTFTTSARAYVLLSDSFSDPDIEWLKPLNGKSVILSKEVKNAGVGLILSTEKSDYTDVQNIYCVDTASEDSATIDLTNVVYYNCCLFIDNTTTFNNVTVKPMLRDARIPDATYVPFCYTNRQLLSYKDNGVLGCKNFADKADSFVSQTINGVTITVNEDNSFTLNNACTTVSALRFSKRINLPSSGMYTCSGTVNTDAILYIHDDTDGESYVDLGAGITVYLNASHNLYLDVQIKVATFTNMTLKPMVKLATDTDPTYQPFSMTNQQLTRTKLPSDSLAPIEDGATALNGYAPYWINGSGYKKYFIRNGKLCKAIAPITVGQTFTLNTNYKETDLNTELGCYYNTVTLSNGATMTWTRWGNVVTFVYNDSDAVTETGVIIPFAPAVQAYGEMIWAGNSNLGYYHLQTDGYTSSINIYPNTEHSGVSFTCTVVVWA